MDFDEEMFDMAVSVKFMKIKSSFQDNSTRLIEEIKEDGQLWVSADKLNIYYEMSKTYYRKLIYFGKDMQLLCNYIRGRWETKVNYSFTQLLFCTQE